MPTNIDTLRPSSWDDFIGQRPLKARLQTHIQSALDRKAPLDHVLLCGPPGFGKTSLANLIASTTMDQMTTLRVPILERALERVLRRFNGILFIDEFHMMPSAQQQTFLSVLEDGEYHLRCGRTVTNGYLTIVAATTERAKIIKPLYDRFTIKPHIEDYTDRELAEIVLRMCRKAKVILTKHDATVLGRASAGVPRNARNLVIMARDLGIQYRRPATADEVLAAAGVTREGLSRDHQEYLQVLYANDGRAGERTLCSMLQLQPAVVNELERLLFRRGLITRESTGRELTTEGFNIFATQTGRTTRR